jgi:predicted LPLAT superfamily acyltransferase
MTQQTAHWSNIEDFGILWGMRFLLWIHRYLGRWLLPIFLYPVIGYYLLTNRLARKASLEYLARLKGYSPNVTVQANAWWCFRHFLSFANSLLDRVSAWTGVLNTDNLVFENRHQLQTQLEKGRGVLMLTAHLGCLEVCRALASFRTDVKLNILVHSKNAARVNALLQPMNLHRSLELVEVTEVSPATAILLNSKIEQGEIVVVVGDRVPVVGAKNTVTSNFLGAPASFAQGPFILAHVLKCPVWTMFCLKQGNKYHIYCEPFAERVSLPRNTRMQELHRYLARYIERLEHYCQLTPLQWFNFYPYWQDQDADSQATAHNNP